MVALNYAGSGNNCSLRRRFFKRGVQQSGRHGRDFQPLFFRRRQSPHRFHYFDAAGIHSVFVPDNHSLCQIHRLFSEKRPGCSNRGSILFDDSSAPEGDDSIASELELEKELEKELERELEQARAEKQQLDEQENQRRLNEEQERETALDEEKGRQKKEKYDRELEKDAIRTNERIKTSGIDLDWKKGKLSELEANRVRLDIESLQYQQSRKGLPGTSGADNRHGRPRRR